MAQELAEQVMTVERALGERMIESALVVIRSWINELGENNEFEEAHAAIRKQYNEQFSLWLTSDDEQIDEQLNSLTGDAYQLSDAVYRAIRLKRGLSPNMHGFNPDSLQSVMNYFLHCINLRPEDVEWLHEVMEDEEHLTVALLALSSLSVSIRECFSIDGIMLFIEGMNSESPLIANICTSSVLKLLIQYDVRIDFFRQIQDAFVEAMREQEDGGEQVVNVLCALIELTKKGAKGEHAKEVSSITDLPEALDELMKSTDIDDEKSAIIQWYPSTELEFMEGLMLMLPDTWIYHVLTDGNPDIEHTIVYVLLSNGFRDMLWDHPNVAEKIFRQKLRKKGGKKPLDYINYAHCLMLKGDRMMAFENYRQARSMCKSVKEFYSFFRPDRSELVDHGVPVEQVYLIEDQLFQN